METLNKNDVLERISAASRRSLEIRQAVAAYPGMEIGAAWRKWKEARGEVAEMLHTSPDQTKQKEMSAAINKLRSRPCARPGCSGTQLLESICNSCVEGKAGYKTKWTCDTCMHRDLSKEGLAEWMLKLSSG